MSIDLLKQINFNTLLGKRLNEERLNHREEIQFLKDEMTKIKRIFGSVANGRKQIKATETVLANTVIENANLKIALEMANLEIRRLNDELKSKEGVDK